MGRFYDKRRWRDRLRRQQLRREPLCRMCLTIGVTKAATDVDHITPIADGGSPDDLDNLRSLCHVHHSSVTRAWQTGRPEPAAALKGCDPATGLPLDPQHFWRKP